MDAQTFLKGLDNIPDLPSLPNIVIKVNQMLQDQETSIKELGKIIETDQAMVSKILRLVNSAFYGFRSKIRNIPHAIIILGFNNVRNAVVSVSIIKTFSGKKHFEGFEIAEFWRHSVAVAVLSRYLSEQTRLDSPDDCFVAGLLHDIGKVVLSQHFTAFFGLVWKSVKEDGSSFYEAEKKLLPVNHAQIGAHLAKKWRFPVSLIDSITYHHKIRNTVSNLSQLVIVHTANSIANKYEVGSDTIPDSSTIDPEAKRIMFRQLETIPEWFPDIATEIESACEFFLKQE
ncbi:MAG: HDOD domain-containing protein [Deltaproteobacteria bacterium]|nr:MAG: HDOD domain-containing protein [Deltaproteobacteria bacterium]